MATDLAAALFIYMCCDLYRREGVGQLGRHEHPAWTAREAKLQDTCLSRGHEHRKLVRERKPEPGWESGQEWLRRRYEYAMEDASERGQSYWEMETC